MTAVSRMAAITLSSPPRFGQRCMSAPAISAGSKAQASSTVEAMGTREWLSVVPDVPPVAEMGYKDFETSHWYGILAPPARRARSSSGPGSRRAERRPAMGLR